MGGAALSVVLASFVEAKCTIYGVADVARVFVFLAVVLPPADRAEAHGPRRLQRPIPAARAAITDFGRVLHRK